jgi:hypothetical protein
MRAKIGIAFVLALSAMSGGCAMTQKMGLPKLRLLTDPPPVVEGLRGGQTEEMWLTEARLAVPPGCTVDSIKVLTDSEASFTFSCFGSGPLGAGL